MVNCLHCLISILALTSLGIAQLTNRECVRHMSADNDVAQICIRSNRLVQVLGNATDLLLDVSQFSTVSPYAFRRMHLQALKLYHPDPATCTPKEIGLTSSLLKNQPNLILLKLECIIVPTDESLFQHVRSVEFLFLNRVNFPEFSSFHLPKFVNLSRLHIQNHGLSSITPETFRNFPKNLTSLNMNGISGPVSPGAFAAFGATLKYLFLQNGSLSQAFQAADSSRIFEGLPHLKTLILDTNGIKAFADSPFHGLPNLEVVDLQSNQISVLGDNLFNHQNLKVLALNDNKIQRLTESCLNKVLGLQELYLGSNQIASIEPSTFNHPALLLVDLSRNQLEGHLARAIFSNVLSLDTLALQSNRISSIESQTFHHVNLSVLDLSHNALTEVPSAAFHRLGRLEILSLHRNQIRTVREGAFRECPNVKRLFLEDNFISDIEIGAFANLNLDVLDLSSNKISVTNANSFHSLRVSHVLSLAFNNVQVVQGGTFNNSKIETIHLCYVGDTDVDWGITPEVVNFVAHEVCTSNL